MEDKKCPRCKDNLRKRGNFERECRSCGYDLHMDEGDKFMGEMSYCESLSSGKLEELESKIDKIAETIAKALKRGKL